MIFKSGFNKVDNATFQDLQRKTQLFFFSISVYYIGGKSCLMLTEKIAHGCWGYPYMRDIIRKLVVRFEFSAFSNRPIESIQIYSLFFNKHPNLRSDNSENSLCFTNRRWFSCSQPQNARLRHFVSLKRKFLYCSLENKPAKSINDGGKEISLTFAKCPLLFYWGKAFMQASKQAKESCSAQVGLGEKQWQISWGEE